MTEKTIYGLTAEYSSTDKLRSGLNQILLAGFTQVEVFSPFPDEQVIEQLKLPPSKLPAIAFSGGCLGAILGYGMQYYTAVLQYPLDIGGRPLHSWPAFVPVTFECCVLGSAVAAFVGFFICNKLPQLHHPMFAVEPFTKVTDEVFFITITANDPRFEASHTRLLLLSSGASEVYDVPS